MKKIISVLVVLMMLVSVFSVSAFAAVNDAVLALRVTPTTTSYTPGEVVTFEVSYESTSEIGGVGACTLHIGYDSSVFEPVETSDAGVLLKDAKNSPVVFDGYALDGKVSNDYSFVQNKGNLDAADTAKGWNASYKIFLVLTGDLFDASSETKVLAFKLKVKDTAANGTYAVGVTQGSINDGSTQVDEEVSPIGGPSGTEYGFSTSKIFDLYDASVTVEGGNGGGTTPPADEPTITIENLDTKVRWATTEEDSRSNVLFVGFEGKLTGVEKEKVSSTISAIGFKFSTSDKTLDENGVLKNGTFAKTLVVYDFTAEAANTYKFRSIVRRPLAATDVDDIEENDTESLNIYAQAFVTIGDTTSYASGIIDTTLKAEYDYATKKGMQKLEDRLA